MSLSYPLTDIIDRMKVKSIEFDPLPQQEISMQGGGAGIVKDLAPMLWIGNFTSNLLTHAEASQLKALFGAMGMSMRSFYATDTRSPYPQSDPTGSILGASTVKINSVSSPTLSFKGLPAGYVLTLGDFFCFDYGSPSSRALHQICETVTADGSGITAAVTVTPVPRLGAAIDQVVTLVKPSCEMRLIPKSWKAANASRVKTQISFQAGQWINA